MDHQSNEARTTLTSSNQFELLLFRLGTVPGDTAHELYGINVFKVREILTMPVITPIVGASRCVMGAVNIRGQIIPVVDLPKLMGCEPTRGLNILLVTEFARTTQGFAVQEVDDIVRLDWNQVLPAETAAGSGLVTSIARIDGNTGIRDWLKWLTSSRSCVTCFQPISMNRRPRKQPRFRCRPAPESSQRTTRDSRAP